MKHFKKMCFILVGIMCCSLSFGQTYNLKVGDTQKLDVPSVPLGYVDKAIWGCSNSAITFIDKSEFSATIKVVRAFEGYATIELIYVEKYLTNKGSYRANTYRKNFYVSCIGGSGNSTTQKATSIMIQPELTVEIGEQAIIPYRILPEGSTAEVWTKTSPGTCFNGISINSQEQYLKGFARAAGTDDLTIYFYDDNDKTISATCVVTVNDPTWVLPESIDVPPAILLSKGESYRILPSLYPKTATTLYEWSSDDKTIASVSQGTVTAKKNGITDVHVGTSNGLLTKCTVIVVEDKTKYKSINSSLNRAANMLKTAEEEIVE